MRKTQPARRRRPADDDTPTREDAIALARTGAPLTAAHLMAILGIHKSAYHYHKRRHRYDGLLLKLPSGRRIYSGLLITRWLDGERVYAPTYGAGTRPAMR